MQFLQILRRPPWRTILPLVVVLGVLGLLYSVWSPGRPVRDGRHDLGTNGIWLQHGWLGDDTWFEKYSKDRALFRDEKRIQALAELLASRGIRYVYPHACPCDPDGRIASVDAAQTERFLDCFGDFRVLPWVGGVLHDHCSPESPVWRTNFVTSVVELLQRHPRLAGIHVNIEPMPDGDPSFLMLLDELHQAMPGKTLSVAAYPPPTLWHPFKEVHWGESYYGEVARRTDQVVPMMYDTAIRLPKLYRSLITIWTKDVLDWSGGTQVLLGVPVYDDAGVGYHFPKVENLQNALLGVHEALSTYKELPSNYGGVAIYCEWEMDTSEWRCFEEEFLKSK